MMANFVTRSLALVLGYAYPAYECFKTVELNKPEIEQLRFWCQYWILVAALTVFERVGESFISWLPMYSEAKLAFLVYLWCPKTKGTAYVYETFLRPYVAKHENEIDRNLLELKTRAGDIVVQYWQKAASYGQTRLFEVLQYIASQSPSQSSRSRPVQPRQQPQQMHRMTSMSAARQPAVSQQHQQQTCAPSSPTKSQLQEPTKAGVPPPAPPAAQPPTSSAVPSSSGSEATAIPTSTGDGGEAMQIDVPNAASKEDPNPNSQETPMEEAIRMTRGRLRKRATAGPSTR